MPKSVEALESKVEDLEEQVEELEEELEELREVRTKNRAQIKQLKADNKELTDAQSQIEEIETEVRNLCVDEKKELLEKKGEAPTDAEVKEYTEKVDGMRYKALRAELKDLAKQRDIIVAIEAKEETGDPEDEESIDDKNKKDGKQYAHQPFAVRTLM